MTLLTLQGYFAPIVVKYASKHQEKLNDLILLNPPVHFPNFPHTIYLFRLFSEVMGLFGLYFPLMGEMGKMGKTTVSMKMGTGQTS